MQSIQLYIEGQRVDMFKDESVSITQSIQNVKDIAKVFTEFTKTFTLPASKTNNKIFKHYYNFDITGGFDARTKKDATLELNYLPFKKGKIKLEGVDLQNRRPKSYRITFFGNTVTLKDLLGEDKLNALTELNTLNETFASSDIKTALQRNPASNDVVVPIITHSKRLYYDSGDNTHNTGNLYYQSGNKHGLAWNELKYALRVHKIIEAIEDRYGITFSTDFFNTSNDVYYDLFMWLHRKKGVVSSGTQTPSFVNSVDFSGATSVTTPFGSLPTSIISFGNLNVVDPTGTTVSRLRLTLSRSTSNPYDISIARDGVEVYAETGITAYSKIYQLSFLLDFCCNLYSYINLHKCSNIYKFRMGYKTYRWWYAYNNYT